MDERRERVAGSSWSGSCGRAGAVLHVVGTPASAPWVVVAGVASGASVDA